MSRLLRQSSQLARLTRVSQPLRFSRTVHSSTLARSVTPTISTIRCTTPWRPYSTKSPKPDQGPENSKKDGKDLKDKKAPKEKDTAEAEQKNEDPDKKPRGAPFQDNWVHLTDEEIKAFAKFGETLPTAQREQLATLLKEIRQTGVPIEARDLVKKRMRGEKLSMLEKGQVLRAMVRMASAMAKADFEAWKRDQDNKYFNQSNKDDLPENESRSQQQESKDGEQDPQKAKGSQKQGAAPPPGSGPSPGGSWADSLQSIVIILSLIWAWEYFTGSNRQQITWQEAKMNYLYKGLVRKFVVEGHNVRMELHADAQSQQPNANLLYFTVGSAESFEANLREAQAELDIPPGDRIPVSYEAGGSTLGNLFLAFGPTLLFIGLIIWTQRSMGGRSGGGGGMFGIGKSKAKKFNAESAVKVKFADVAGLDEAKVEVTEFVQFLKNPQKFEKLGAKIPRGAILAGPPGTGKTLLAKATAGESGVPFFSVSGSEFVEMFVGVGPSRVRDLFAEGRKSAPCIIFIDEIDAIGRSRAGNNKFSGGNDERESTLNQILTEMDGFNTREQVVVLAGTNRPEILDEALMRPGRFDRHIHCDRPTMKGRKEIFQVYLKKIVTKEDHDHLIGRLSTLTPGFSGADISNVVNEAALIAARANAEDVQMVHFEQAIERVIGGLERKSLVLRPEEKKTVAYHEAGHAICGWFLENADPLLKVSIIPRGQGALGYAQYLPQDAYLMSTKQLMDRMAMTLGGRISEELHFPTVTSGASDDFKKVSQMARKMVKDWGMSELGPVHYEDDPNSMQKGHSEATAVKIDAEVTRIVNDAYQKCKDLLTEKKKEVGLIAEELLKKEMLVRDDLVRILGQRPFSNNHDEFEKYFGGEQGKGQPQNPVETDNPDQGTPAPAFKQLPTEDSQR